MAGRSLGERSLVERQDNPPDVPRHGSGGVNGRPLEAVVVDYESKPDIGRRKAEKLTLEDKVDVVEGGYLSNVCLACMPVFEEAKTVYMIGVCLDTTITQSKCSRYVFRPFDYAPAQAVAAAPYMVNKMGKKWYIAYADYAWGQSTKDAFAAEIKKNGGEVAGTLGIPLGTTELTPFLSKITGQFDAVFGIFFGPQGIAFVTQSYDLGLSKKYKIAGDGAIAVSTNLPAMGAKADGFLDEATRRLKEIDPSGPLPDRYVQSNYEAVNALKIGMQKSGFRGKEDTMKLIEALEGLEMKEGDDFPQGDKLLRKEDHQAFLREFIFEVQGGKFKTLEVVPKEKTLVPPTGCKFA
jgi:branched-chain amino acid transport system substrate-binding protein